MYLNNIRLFFICVVVISLSVLVFESHKNYWTDVTEILLNALLYPEVTPDLQTAAVLVFSPLEDDGLLYDIITTKS